MTNFFLTIVVLLVPLTDARFFRKCPKQISESKRARNTTSHNTPPPIIISPTLLFDDAFLSINMDPVVGYLMLS